MATNLLSQSIARTGRSIWIRPCAQIRNRSPAQMGAFKEMSTSSTTAQRIVSDIDATVRSMSGGLNGNGMKKSVTESTIIVQEGHEIQELPVMVITTNCTDAGGSIGTNERNEIKKEPAKSFILLSAQEEKAIIDAFNSYHTPKEVLRVLDTVPSQEVTPQISFCVLKKLFQLESNFGFRNQGKSWILSSENGTHETFARAAIVDRLVNTIVASERPELILDTLELLQSDSQAPVRMDADELRNYRTRLCYNVLVSITTGKFSLAETCRAVCIVGKMEKEDKFTIENSFIDKMWVGIASKRDEISATNIKELFRTIFYFKKSRRLVCSLLEKKLMTLWWGMDTETVADICDIVSGEMKNGETTRLGETWDWCITGNMLMALSRCVSLNMHQITEDQLIRVMKCFQTRKFCDTSIQQAVAKYMKARATKITSQEVYSVVADYGKYFRLRIPAILNALENHVIANSKTISTPQMTSIVTYFGHVNYLPLNGTQFWRFLEAYLDEKFIQFPPREILDVLLSCICVGKYPLNFVDKVFSPYFLDRIHSSESSQRDLLKVREKLKLLDVTLNLECGAQYAGPFLPKDFSAKSFQQDGRVQHVIATMVDVISEHCKNSHIVQTNTFLPGFAALEFYKLDMLIYPKNQGEFFLMNYLKNQLSLRKHSFTPRPLSSVSPIKAILIQIPENYCHDGTTLVGRESMRVRQLQNIGLHVINVKFVEWLQFRNSALAVKRFVRSLIMDMETV